MHHEAHVADESHIKHPVGLIEDDGAEARQVEGAALDQVLEAAGRSDHEAIVEAERAKLCADGRAADAGGGMDEEAFDECPELLVDLHGKFASRDDDEDGFRAVQDDLVYERDKKSSRLAGAGVRDADDVRTLENHRDGLVLNGRRRGVALECDIRLENGINREVGERIFGNVGRRLNRGDFFVHIAADVNRLGTKAPAKLRSLLAAKSWFAAGWSLGSVMGMHDYRVKGRSAPGR